MPLSKSAVLVCSCNCIPGIPYTSASITSSLGSRPLHFSSSSSSLSTSTISKRQLHPLHQNRRRSYATVNDPRDSAHHPSQWPKNPQPTPYEIFSMQRKDLYTKHRFYELVKIYHPDRHNHASDIHSLPKATRLERYRLIVAANDLLSNPSKRRLYDTHGVGWTGDRPPTLNESVRHAEHKWRDQPGNASRNATWEDWERWYEARDGKAKDSLHMSNGFFATLVVMMCMIGAFAQMSRAEQSGAEYMEMAQQSNMAIGQQMARNTSIASGRSKDERVDNFLKDRENLAYAFSPSKYDNWPPDNLHGDGSGPRTRP